MSREHLIVCGPQTGRRTAGPTSRSRVHLDTRPRVGNVNLRVQDITARMLANLPPVAEDLVELATYVYAADQATERGNNFTFDYGTAWRRRFRFDVQVRCPDFWNSERVNSELVRTLSFLSDDDYEFNFRPLKRPTRWAEYLDYENRSAEDKEVEDVVLFSGGLDSLAGAVEEVLVHRRRVAKAG